MKKLIFPCVAVVSTLLVGALLVVIAGASPLLAAQYFLYGILGNLNGFVEILVKATPLMFLGLGVAVAFRTGFFNIGGEGQLYMGALAAAMVTLLLPGVPGAVRVLLAIAASFAAGGLWNHQSAADSAGEGVTAGMGLIISLFKGFSFVFPCHGNRPPKR